LSAELTGTILDKYYDIQKKKFWYKKKYLVAEHDEKRFECYDETSDPVQFISRSKVF
jgi:hypothetical protein